jgi:uncharacterized protein DUF1572
MNSPILDVVRDELQKVKQLADKSIAQVDDQQLWTTLDSEANSIAILMRHMAGNMRSRWTDFLISDGEKPDRHRDQEFEAPPATRGALLKLWEEGWNCLFSALEPLSDADLHRTVAIRGEPHSVVQAIHRQLAHYPYHCGQIVFLAKHFRGREWQSLSIPRGKSTSFNERVAKGEASQR